MQLQRLRLPAFRNLRDVDIVFASHLSPAVGVLAEAPAKAIRSHALIGQNGTGKSNLIEALITIFRDLDLDRPQAPFDYELEYGKRLKLNEHVPLAEARRKVWQQVDKLIEDFTNAKARCGAGDNPAAKAKLSQVRASVREMTNPTAELSAVARWCLLLRNDPQLSRLVG